MTSATRLLQAADGERGTVGSQRQQRHQLIATTLSPPSALALALCTRRLRSRLRFQRRRSAHQIRRGRNQPFNSELTCLLLLHPSRCCCTRTVGLLFFLLGRSQLSPHCSQHLHSRLILTPLIRSSPTPGDSTHGQKESQERRRRCSRRAASAATEAATGAASAAGICLPCAQ